MLNLQSFIYSKNVFLIPYLGNVNYRKNFTGWYHDKITKPDRHEIYLITRGKGRFTLNGQTYPVSEGSLIYIPAAEGLRYSLFPDFDVLEYYSINFSCAVVCHRDEVWLYDQVAGFHYLSAPDPSHEDWGFEPSCEAFRLPTVSSSYNSLLPKLLDQLYQLRQQSGPVNFWNEKNLLQQFLCELALVNQAPTSEDINVKRLHQLLQYIKQHYMEEITLETLCGLVSLSPCYVSRLFRQYTRLSPIAYVNHVRIENAKLLLSESLLPIAEIAAKIGYRDAFYFSKKFKQATGVTPRQYRTKPP